MSDIETAILNRLKTKGFFMVYRVSSCSMHVGYRCFSAHFEPAFYKKLPRDIFQTFVSTGVDLVDGAWPIAYIVDTLATQIKTLNLSVEAC